MRLNCLKVSVLVFQLYELGGGLRLLNAIKTRLSLALKTYCSCNTRPNASTGRLVTIEYHMAMVALTTPAAISFYLNSRFNFDRFIKFDMMNVETAKYELLHKLMQTTDVQLLTQLFAVFQKSVPTSHPNELVLYNNELEAAETRIQGGDFSSHEDVVGESESW